MREVLLVTYVNFWKRGSGSSSRIAALVHHLKKISQLTTLFIGPVDDEDLLVLEREYEDITFEYLERTSLLSIPEYIQKFSQFIADRFYHLVFLEYIEMVHIVDFFPKDTTTILDTHDILSDKIKTFQQHNLAYDGMVVSFEDEIHIFSKFDYIILINRIDFEKVNKHISSDKLLLVPHPVSYQKSKIREHVKSILFVASGYSPNVLALKWFLSEVWPVFINSDIQLNIIGHVVKMFGEHLPISTNVNFIGYVEDLETVYRTADIVINPVKAGAGIKIKNLEALGHGLPLITTTHGASGLEDAVLSGCLSVSDSTETFISTLNMLISSFSMRLEIGNNAYNYASTQFSPERCFMPVTNLVISNN